jgi:hypothetical protein
MSCLADERFVEILDGGGLDATRPDERAHLESCETCRDSWAAVAAAAEVLAESRPPTARGRLVPVLIAAAMLLAIVGLVVWKSSPPPVEQKRDPIVMLLNGTPEEVRAAREALLQQGRKAIPTLVAARPRFKGSARLQTLQDLIFDLKRASVQQDLDAVVVFKKLELMRVDLMFEDAKLEDILVFIRDFSGLNVVLDPTLADGKVDKYEMKDATLRSCLEILCAVKDLDFDYRYGVLFLSTPLRLWSLDPAVGLPMANAWEKQILGGADAAAADKIRSIRITIDMQNAPISAVADYLSEISGIKFKTDPAIADPPITVKVMDATLDRALRLMTLPRDWDLRIEGGAAHLVPRRK